MEKRTCRCGWIRILFCIFLVGFVLVNGLKQNRERVSSVTVLLQEDEEQAFSNVLCSCVRIQGNGYYGSGTIYRITDEQMIIVTNRHVLKHYEQGSYVTFFDGKDVEGEVLFLCDDYDLGFLAVEKDAFSEEELTAYGQAVCNMDVYHELKKNDRFFMVDTATDVKNPRKYSGEVMSPYKYLEDYGQEMFYGDAYAIEGMSGCGIFDGRGYYLALLSGKTPYNEIAAVPLDVIETEFQKIRR